MKKTTLLFFLLAFTAVLQAQSTISGRITDYETKEPLAGASVFAQNTTRGTTTDTGGRYTLYLEKGGYELIISFTGFTTRTISVESSGDRQFNIELQKADNSMSEVVIKNSNEVPDGWEKYGKFFTESFIGSTPFSDSCTLENPQALRFLYFKRNDRLKVLASEPLIISNRALGYQLRYQLDSFVHFFQKDINSYRGQCFYTAMDGTAEQQKQWAKNRKEAYYGSRMHFTRSYYDSTLKREGFTVDILTDRESGRFARLANPYDTSYYYFIDSLSDAELYFPVTASISYTRKAPEKQYLEQRHLPANVMQQISYIDLLDGIVIKPNGYFFDQKSWVNQGYWSWKNLADQLPYDYDPEN
jgi:hypothetical protein